jgi:hypothetical protein
MASLKSVPGANSPLHQVIRLADSKRHTGSSSNAHTPEPGFSNFYWLRSSLGCGRFRPARSRLRVKESKHIPTPLSVDQVAKFWSGFRTARDNGVGRDLRSSFEWLGSRPTRQLITTSSRTSKAYGAPSARHCPTRGSPQLPFESTTAKHALS